MVQSSGSGWPINLFLEYGCTRRYWAPKTIHQSGTMHMSFQISLPLLGFEARGLSGQKSISLGLSSAAEGILINLRRAKHKSIENPNVETLLRPTSCHFLFRRCMRRKAESFSNRPGRWHLETPQAPSKSGGSGRCINLPDWSWREILRLCLTSDPIYRVIKVGVWFLDT